MEIINDAIAQELRLSKKSLEAILVSLSVFAPFMTSELLEILFLLPITEVLPLSPFFVYKLILWGPKRLGRGR